MNTTALSKEEVLALLPQKHPFLFVDEISELSDRHIVGHYTFNKNAYFYAGHFPNNPVTPGVILLESMAQVGVVALGIYLASLDNLDVAKYMTVFVDAQTEFLAPVIPDARVTIRAEKIFWRQKKLRAKAELYLENGKLAAVSTLSGIGVPI